MAFIYDLSDTWNNAGISFSGIKINVTDSASAAGSKLLDLQIGSASKFTVGKTGTVTATGLIESTVGGFKFPDGTTQTTKATVNSVSGTGTVNGITLTGTVTDSGSLTLGGTLGNIANSQLTNSAITINGTSTALGGSISVGTVTSVSGTGTVSGLSLTGSVTTSGSLTLGGTLVLTSGQVTDGLGYTPYNATNPAGYTTNVGTVTSVAGTGTVNGLTLTGTVTTSGSLTLGGTLGNIANSQLTNSAITINGTSTALGGSISVGTVTSVAALTLGTSGTDLASSVANGTTTPVITLNVPTASATNRGALSSSDWSTFNAKQAALVSGTNIKTVGGASLLGSGDVGTIGLAYGGTGATTASGARTALGLGTAAVLNAGVAGGVATLDGSGTVPTSQLPGAVLGGLNYQGTWNASTNTPTLASSTGSKGYYYVVSVAGSTNLNGITDWKIGDWAVYDGTTWQKVDNTDAVSSVNGFTGAVVLTTSDVAQGTNLYFTQAAARGSVSAGTGISYNSTSGVITNSAPDQTVALTGAGTTVVTGTYPNFTITSNDSTVGTVTSVAASGGTTGLTFTGSPITTAGTLTLGGTLDLDNGGTGATTASGARTALGLGTAATTDASAYATAAQGAKADTAVQTIASTDGSVTITGTTALDLSVAVAGSTSNVLLPVRNTTGATLTKGTAVYISGATGQLSTVSKAIATGDATSAQTLGLVTANISNNSNGNVTLIGTITNIDTSAYTDGQQLYLSPTTAGTLTGTKPYAPNHLVYMAVVESAHPSQGKLFVKVQNGYEMDELHDVSAQSPTNGQTLVYNSTTDLWEKNTVSLTAGVNGTLPVANGGTGATTLSSGYLLKGNGTSAVSASVVYDTGTNVGIGTSSPFAKLEVNGGIRTTTGSGGTLTLFETNATRANMFIAGADASGAYIDSSYSSGGSGAVIFRIIGTERMRIAASGRVGIGTTNPQLQLVVSNSGAAGLEFDPSGVIQSYNRGTSAYQSLTLDGETVVFRPSGTERMRLNASGNLLLSGASTGDQYIRVGSGRSGNGYSYIDLQGDTTYSNGLRIIRTNGGANSSSNIEHRGTGQLQLITQEAAPITFLTSATERMRIDASGNVGIGITNPQQLLALGTSTDQVGAGVSGAVSTVYFGSPSNISGGIKRIAYDRASGNLNFIGGSVASPSTQMTLDSNGALGIGTPTPGVKLEVVQNQATYSYFDYYNTTANGGIVWRQIYRNIANTGNATIDFAKLIGGGFALNNTDTNAANFTAFGVGASERMRITSSGNVGIGTSAPSTILHAVAVGSELRSENTSTTQFQSGRVRLKGPAGTYRSTTLEHGNNNTGGTNTYFTIIGADSSDIYLQTLALYDYASQFWLFSTNGAERMRINSSGNVGIGTSSPVGKIDYISGSARVYMTDQGSAGFITAVNTTNTAYSPLAINGSLLFFKTGDAERARIDSSGNFMVGTTTLGGANGFSIDTVGINGVSVALWNRTARATTSYPAIFRDNSVDIGSISYTNTAVAYNTTSDARLKHDIIDAPEASSLIDAIQVRSFKWNVDDSEQRYGFVAQELVTVAPEAVSQPEDPEGMMAVDYSKLVPMLVKEIQSLRARVAQLEGN